MGQVLFHLPTSKSHKVLLKLVIFVWVGIMLMQIVFLIKEGWQSAPQFLARDSSTHIFPYFVCIPPNRFEIREAGIISQGNFVKWEKLNAFQWKKEGGLRIRIGQRGVCTRRDKIRG